MKWVVNGAPWQASIILDWIIIIMTESHGILSTDYKAVQRASAAILESGT